VAKQDFPHESVELIIVDDGSRDRTLPVVRKTTSTMDIQAIILSYPWKGLAFSRQVVVDNSAARRLA
jgi:glycosyltransferase involved in cell wall biosynthesis